MVAPPQSHPPFPQGCLIADHDHRAQLFLTRARRRFRADTGREEAAGPAVLGENGWGVVPGREGRRLSVAVRFVDNEGAAR